MSLSMNFQQKLDTKYFLTPQLKQSLELLQYSMQELEDYIRSEANENPLIELHSPLSEENETIALARMSNDQRVNSHYSDDDSLSFINQLSSSGESLERYLTEQLVLHKHLKRLDRDIILYYIRSINSRGYLDCEIKEVSEHFKVPLTKCEELLSLFQQFEPVGIGARNLKECLLLQIKRKKEAPKLTSLLVQNHLEDLAERNFGLLANQYNVSEEEVQKVFSYIQQLNPYPLIEIETVKTEYIIPDIIVEEFDGEFIIRVNDFYLPKISINSYYEELLKTNTEAIDYLKTKLSDAILLMKGIEQRHETLYRVTRVVLQKQRAFLKKGRKALGPLTLKDVAENLEVHESTVSRAIRDKYIQTPQGLFPLKSLFIRGLKMSSGMIESTALIKEKIKIIIENENREKPYSDQKIANLLLTEGIQIARRTVAKYREELGILQSTKRVMK